MDYACSACGAPPGALHRRNCPTRQGAPPEANAVHRPLSWVQDPPADPSLDRRMASGLSWVLFGALVVAGWAIGAIVLLKLHEWVHTL